MISIYHKVNDHFEVTNDLALLATIKKQNIVWVDLLGWDEKSEKLIENHFGLEIMNNKEQVEIEQSARYVEYEDHIVSHSNFVTRQGLSLVPKIVSFTVEKNLLITNRDYDFRSFIETSKKVLSANSKLTSSDVFLSIIDLRIANDADLVEDLT
ncbi:MAG: CorA family divalent cation transporter, partial [Bacteroidia bacterium]